MDKGLCEALLRGSKMGIDCLLWLIRCQLFWLWLSVKGIGADVDKYRSVYKRYDRYPMDLHRKKSGLELPHSNPYPLPIPPSLTQNHPSAQQADTPTELQHQLRSKF